MSRKKMHVHNEKTIREVYDEFILDCRARNLSSYTIKHYETQMAVFFEFHDGENDIITLTAALFQKYVLYCQKKEITSTTVQTYTKVIRTFYHYCMDHFYIERFKVFLPKAEKTLKEVYTDEELKVLLKKPDLKKATFAEYRTWVMINYFLATGNRLNTVIHLRIKDIDLSNGTVRLATTKNKKQQLIPITKTLVHILSEYMAMRKGKSDDFLFCNTYGEPMTKTCLCNYIWHYNRSRGVQKTSVHLFRHTYAKKYLMAGGDIFRLSKLLGHSNINITKEYLNLVLTDLEQDYDQFNPLEQIAGKERKVVVGKGK